jgi:hypothetical protein
MAEYIPPNRNFDKIQFADIRKDLDPKFNDIHDELTRCYYGRLSYLDYGILDKETFDKLHGLIFDHHAVEFHDTNLTLPKKDRIPEAKYRYIYDEKGQIQSDKVAKAQTNIAGMKVAGVELTAISAVAPKEIIDEGIAINK